MSAKSRLILLGVLVVAMYASGALGIALARKEPSKESARRKFVQALVTLAIATFGLIVVIMLVLG